MGLQTTEIVPRYVTRRGRMCLCARMLLPPARVRTEVGQLTRAIAIRCSHVRNEQRYIPSRNVGELQEPPGGRGMRRG